MMQWMQRTPDETVVKELVRAGAHPMLASLWSARGVKHAAELDPGLQHLIAPSALEGCQEAAELLEQTRAQAQGSVVIVADYDCDGATACAVAWRGLKALGFASERLGYVVPDRARHGYGLTPAIVDLVLSRFPQTSLMITVDNGIASLEGIAYAKARGLKTIVTDHHLPVRQDGQVLLPEADVIVNPVLAPRAAGRAPFPSPSMAGVGVMFYVLLAFRAHRRQLGHFDAKTQPPLDGLLDLVALGTVADVARLDLNNRRLVAQALQRIRSGKMQAGLRCLMEVTGRSWERWQTEDFGFSMGPRINAAGRLADMTLGIETLITDDPATAMRLARQLNDINEERKLIEGQMREQAMQWMERFNGDLQDEASWVVFGEEFHEGVIGILASRIKERWHRPTLVLARAQDGSLKGSARSIQGFHFRDALDAVSKAHPELFDRFGGHAMAAGCTLSAALCAGKSQQELEAPGGAVYMLRRALSALAQEQIPSTSLGRVCLTDGALHPDWNHVEAARLVQNQVWGQAFEAPVFEAEVELLSQKLLAEKHLRLTLSWQGQSQEAIWFQHAEPLLGSGSPTRLRVAFRMDINDYGGRQRLQWIVQHAEVLN